MTNERALGIATRAGLAGLLVACLPACAGWLAAPTPAVPPAPAMVAASNDGTVLVTAASDLGRPCEVLALLELRSANASPELGYAELRRWAATLGGDAVVVARVEPGANGGPTHVSGVVVRSRTRDLRPYDVVAELDVQTDEGSDDKGLVTLRTRARELGADKIVNVRFEHDGRGIAHLRGVAVRYRR